MRLLLANIMCRGPGDGTRFGDGFSHDGDGGDCQSERRGVDERAAWSVVSMRIGWSAFGMVLFVWTSPLWLGTTGFPQVPLAAIGHRLPSAMDGVWYAFVLASMISVLVLSLASRWRGNLVSSLARWPLVTFVLTFTPLVVGNLHRLQPWAYLAWLTAVAMLCRPKLALVLLRVLVISIYFHSALSKLDYAFVSTLGMTFWESIRASVGLDKGGGQLNQLVVFVFPMTELLVAVGLIFRATRRTAFGLAVLMHVWLIWLLAFRLKHEAPVVVWNLYFIWQAVVLFAGRANTDHATLDSRVAQLRLHANDKYPMLTAVYKRVGLVAILLAVMLPFLEPIGWFDHWPSWGLYAPRNSRCRLFVRDLAADRLPDEWRLASAPSLDVEQGWNPGLEVAISAASLRQAGVPIYPQDRFQLGVAIDIVRRYGLEEEATIILESASDRTTGRRKRQSFRGRTEIESATTRFWLNSMPRVQSLDHLAPRHADSWHLRSDRPDEALGN